jgi:cobalt-zinc-cadmium efflux system protein
MTQQRRLSYVLLLNVAMITGLVIVGLTSHSLGVLAAGGDFIADSTAIVLGLIAVHLRDKHGNHRAPTYVALINGLLLLTITILVLVQAIERLITQSPEVHGLPVLIVSLLSASAMVASVFILGRGSGNEDLHMRSVLLDTVSDGLAAAAVAVVGAIIFFVHGAYWLDSAVAVIISIFIGLGALKLLKDVATALHKGIPIKAQND